MRQAFFHALARLIADHRSADPTRPVRVVVAGAREAVDLRRAMARADAPALHIGVDVATPLQFAARGRQLADRNAIVSAVRQVAGEGYFAALHGLTGVSAQLASAVLLWDQALTIQREQLLRRSRHDVDRQRLHAVHQLHDDVCGVIHDRGLVLPSDVLGAADGTDGRNVADLDRVWHDVIVVDCVVGALPPREHAWWEATGQAWIAAGLPAERWFRFDPLVWAGQPEPARVISAVDPVDEAGIAARLVAGALARGVAARDIAVAVPGSQAARYRELVAGQLAAAAVVCDGGDPQAELVRGTRAGQACSALLECVVEIDRARDLRFDHLRRVVEPAGMSDTAGERLTASRLRHVWHASRGTDPATWADGLPDAPDPLASEALGRVARVLLLLRQADNGDATWTEVAVAIAAVLDLVPAANAQDAAGGAALALLLDRWRGENSIARATFIAEDLRSVLNASLADASGGVRIVDLAVAWSVAAEYAVVVGMADDLVPGVLGAVGPLTAPEVLHLQSPGGDTSAVMSADGQSLAALAAMSGPVTATYPRSDQLRTLERQPSRFLPSDGSAFGSIAAQFAAADGGGLALLGATDAAAAAVRADIDLGAAGAWAGRDLDVARAALAARLHPGDDRAGGVDAFNGDISGIDTDDRGPIAPDNRGDAPPWASPSQLEKLLACPIGWWAGRVVGIEEPSDWDPAELDAAGRGKWVHRALVLLSERHQLLADDLDHESVVRALWDAIGGDPSRDSGEMNRDTADPELLGFRYRLDTAALTRAARDTAVIAERLRRFLLERGRLTSEPLHEVLLAPAVLATDEGNLWLSGRVDRIDYLSDGRHVVTDYKTGAAGSGFQLAVYGWLLLVAGQAGDTTELLYADTRGGTGRDYVATVLDREAVDDGPPDTVFTEEELRRYLVDRVTPALHQVNEAAFFSRAWAADHDRYCPVCTDLVLGKNRFGGPASSRGTRALALASVPPPDIDEGHTPAANGGVR